VIRPTARSAGIGAALGAAAGLAAVTGAVAPVSLLAAGGPGDAVGAGVATGVGAGAAGVAPGAPCARVSEVGACSGLAVTSRRFRRPSLLRMMRAKKSPRSSAATCTFGGPEPRLKLIPFAEKEFQRKKLSLVSLSVIRPLPRAASPR